MFEDPQLFGKLPGRHKQSMVGQINPIGRRRESYIDAKLSQSIASCKLGLTTTSYSVYRLGNGTCLYKIWANAGDRVKPCLYSHFYTKYVCLSPHPRAKNASKCG